MRKQPQGDVPQIRSELNNPMPSILIALDTSLKKARARGRRDFRVHVNEDGTCPAIVAFRETIHERVMLISEDLRDQVAAVDRRIAAALQELVSIEVDLDEAAESPSSDPHEIRAQRRRADAAKAKSDRATALKMEIATKLSDRRHIHAQARDSAEQLSAAFQAMAASYRQGQEEGPWWFWWRARRHIDAQFPTMALSVAWLEEDIPLMDQVVDPTASKVITWAYRTFLPPADRRDSHPVASLLGE